MNLSILFLFDDVGFPKFLVSQGSLKFTALGQAPIFFTDTGYRSGQLATWNTSHPQEPSTGDRLIYQSPQFQLATNLHPEFFLSQQN